MLTIKLCWAWTVWKSQGMTIKSKIVVTLTDREKEHGLKYVALSRVTKFSDIGIYDRIAKQRLCSAIKNQSKMRKRMEEEARFSRLCDLTLSKLES